MQPEFSISAIGVCGQLFGQSQPIRTAIVSEIGTIMHDEH